MLGSNAGSATLFQSSSPPSSSYARRDIFLVLSLPNAPSCLRIAGFGCFQQQLCHGVMDSCSGRGVPYVDVASPWRRYSLIMILEDLISGSINYGRVVMGLYMWQVRPISNQRGGVRGLLGIRGGRNLRVSYGLAGSVPRCSRFYHSSCIFLPFLDSLCHFSCTTLFPHFFLHLLAVGGSSYVLGRTGNVDVAHTKRDMCACFQ